MIGGPLDKAYAPQKLMASFLGLQPYDRVLTLQRALAETIQRGFCNETILALEHAAVITLGKRANVNNITVPRAWLEQKEIAVCPTERGGDVTYHGPGQLVVYPIFRIGRAVKAHVTALAQATAQTLDSLGIEAVWSDQRPGLWVGNEKIAAVGVAVQGGVAFHGLALNASVDLSAFEAIVPCGLTDAGVTSIKNILGHSPPLEMLAEELLVRLSSITGRPAPTFFSPPQLFSYFSSLKTPRLQAISLDFLQETA